MRVSRAKATFRTGKKKGRLKPGCRYLKGDGADCKSPGAKKRGRKTTSRRGKKRGKKKHPCATANPPAWCNKKGKRKGARKKRKGGRAGIAPRTPSMSRLNEWRRAWKRGDCGEKKTALRMIKKQFQHMAAKPPSTKRGESAGAVAQRRWKRWQSEYVNKLRDTEAYCSGRKRGRVPIAPFPAMVDGLGRTRSRSKKKHPCATANPPSWCN